jgi:putative spermidine/putrescine transport system substrate-binding protein
MTTRILFYVALIILLAFLSAGCTKESTNHKSEFTSWEDVSFEGKNKEVTIFMWGGNDSVNRYMDGYVADELLKSFGIVLKRVPMNAPEFINKLINEKKAGIGKGSADILWINAENFRTAKQGGLLWGPFTDLLPNQKQFYDTGAIDLRYDTGIPIEGYEAIWGRAQLVFTYDAARVEKVPKSYEELLLWLKDNPGRFTYPKLPDDFVGAAFIRNSYYELTGKYNEFQTEMSSEEFLEISEPVITYFKEMNPYLWYEGKAFPSSQAQLDELFKNGEVDITMGFEVGKTAGLVAAGVYPGTVKTFVFDTGTIGNAHYLAIPFNSPQKAAALLVIDFLQSPKAQIKKMDPGTWGDMPAIDPVKLDTGAANELSELSGGEASLSLEELNEKRLPEMNSQYIEWIKDIWIEHIGGKE